MKTYKMKWNLIVVLGICCSAMMSANAGPIGYVDVGHRDNDLQGTQDGSGNYWTTFGWQDTPDSNVSILDSVTGLGTGWIIDFANVEGDSPNSVMPAGHVFSDSGAATDGLWNRPSGTDQRMIITISGLDASGVETYNLSFYGNRSNSDDAASIFEVQGAGALISSGIILQGDTTGATSPWDTAGVQPAGVQADGSGNIVIEMATPGTYDLSILSAMSIVAVPEPATLGMVVVFGGAILFIRRRLLI